MKNAARSGFRSFPFLLSASARCFLLVLAGCARVAAPAPRPYVVEVPVPTPIYCDAPALAPPALPIATLGAGSPPADTVRSYAATVIVLKAALAERDSILAGCAPPASASTDGNKL